jgi:hypothetical protein
VGAARRGGGLDFVAGREGLPSRSFAGGGLARTAGPASGVAGGGGRGEAAAFALCGGLEAATRGGGGGGGGGGFGGFGGGLTALRGGA